ncbi:MAG: TIR domain-containing protein, partial [Bacteroidota bacterium]
MKIFLSHSSADKAFVRRINSDLKSHGFGTWLDEEQILLGGSISETIEIGLSQSDVLILFLSQRSVTSRWVSAEWRSKFAKTMSENRISVIPLVMDDCEIPDFLVDRKYADFRAKDNYEPNLSHLLNTLNILSSQLDDSGASANADRSSSSILDLTEGLLDDIADQYLSFPTHRRLPLVDGLKKLPRSGKQLRLQNYKPAGKKNGLKVRTVYDHILSMAHVADCLMPHFEHGLEDSDLIDLARCIAYHELNEVILGDIPTYTSLSARARSSARVYAEARLRTVEPKKRAQVVGDLIWMYLDEKHRKSLDRFHEICSRPKSKVYLVFKYLDKLDPIIGVWRYLHHYRGSLGDTPKEFNKKMKDFFENPDVRAYLKSS